MKAFEQSSSGTARLAFSGIWFLRPKKSALAFFPRSSFFLFSHRFLFSVTWSQMKWFRKGASGATEGLNSKTIQAINPTALLVHPFHKNYLWGRGASPVNILARSATLPGGTPIKWITGRTATDSKNVCPANQKFSPISALFTMYIEVKLRNTETTSIQKLLM